MWCEDELAERSGLPCLLRRKLCEVLFPSRAHDDQMWKEWDCSSRQASGAIAAHLWKDGGKQASGMRALQPWLGWHR